MYRGMYRLKPYKDKWLQPLAACLLKCKISANSVTVLGLVAGISAAFCIGKQKLFWGVLLICLSLFADILDGTLARLGNRESFGGKILDSLSDRLVEIAWVGALIQTGMLSVWGWILPFGSVLLLFFRLWAFRSGLNTSFLIIARFERAVVILGLIILPWRWLTIPAYFCVAGATMISNVFLFISIFRKRARRVSTRHIM